SRQAQRLQQQRDHFDICRYPGFTIKLDSGLDWSAGSQGILRLGVHHMTGITQTIGTATITAVGIYASSLRGDIGANSKSAPGELIGNFKGQQIDVAT